MGTTIEDLHPDILAWALRLLDGPSLAAVGCATSHLKSLSSEPALWQDLCLSTWPSLSHPRLLALYLMSHRSLFSDSFPFPSSQSAPSIDPPALPNSLISAVDLYHKGKPIFSRVTETDTSSDWFLGSPFQIDVLDSKEQHPPSAVAGEITPAELTLSWILIDPDQKRAVNLSSRRPVAVDRHWYTGETLVRFAIVINGLLVHAVVTCWEESGHVREISLGLEDGDGIGVSGRESMLLLVEAMEGKRRGRGRGRGTGEEEMEAKRRYEDFVKRKRRRKESKARRECLVDLFCTAVGAAVFLAFLFLVAFR